MIRSPSDEVSRVLKLMPACWKDDYKLQQANAAARLNRALALDHAPPGSSLDADINQFFHPSQRGDQMPYNNGAAMPPSRFDNGDPAPISRLPAGMVARELARRNGNGNGDNASGNMLRGYGPGGSAEDQIDAQQVIEYVQMCLEALRDDEQQEAALLQGLAGLLDQAFNSVPANDQEGGSSIRLPVGPGVPPSNLYAPEMSNAGSGSPRSAAWEGTGQPPATDRARLGAGRRWPAGDRRPAYDQRRRPAYDSRAQPVGDFASRFPEAMKISCW